MNLITNSALSHIKQKKTNEISKTEFTTLNTILHPDLLNYMLHFQQRENPGMLTVFNKQGVYGCLVQEISNIFSLLEKEPLWDTNSNSHSKTHLLTLGNYKGLGSIRLTFRMINIILSSVKFRANDVSTTTLINKFQPGDTWLTDEHINIIRLLLHQKRLIPPSGKTLILSDKTIIADTFFYVLLQSERHTAINGLKTILEQHQLYNAGKCTAEEILFPINLSYGHWILIYVDFYNRTFYPINPYRPTTPNSNELHIAKCIITEICKSFLGEKPIFVNGDIPEKNRRPAFCLRPPTCIHTLPVQFHGESIKCGVQSYTC